MRPKTLQLVSFATVVFAASISFASPTHPAAKPAHKPSAPVRPTASKLHAEIKLTARRPAPIPAKGRHAAARPEPRVEARQSPHQKPVEHVRPERVEPAPVTRHEPASVPDEDIHVQHDRHQHFSAEPTAEVPHIATREDFLASNAEPEPKAAAPIVRQTPAKPVVAAEPKPVVVAIQYDKRGRVILPPALKGSHEILLHQNEMADQEGLDRIQDDAGLDGMREAKLLVPIPAVAGLQTNEGLPANRRYCRPWTAQFLAALARAHYAKFHSALQVNSAVRTVEFQTRLLLTNGNAAPAEGETASPHLTGQAIDLAKRGLSMTEIAWLRGYLLPLVQAGKVDVEEEFQQSCFHISVYKKYLPEAAPPRDIIPKRSAASALATAIR